MAKATCAGHCSPPALSSPLRVWRLGAALPDGPRQGQSMAGLWLVLGSGVAAAGIGRQPGRSGLGSPGAETQPGTPGSWNWRGQKRGPRSFPRLTKTTHSRAFLAPRTVHMHAQGSCSSPWLLVTGQGGEDHVAWSWFVSAIPGGQYFLCLLPRLLRRVWALQLLPQSSTPHSRHGPLIYLVALDCMEALGIHRSHVQVKPTRDLKHWNCNSPAHPAPVALFHFFFLWELRHSLLISSPVRRQVQ